MIKDGVELDIINIFMNGICADLKEEEKQSFLGFPSGTYIYIFHHAI